MTSPNPDLLFNLLPGIIRGADDAQPGQPLRVLYDVLQTAYDEMHRDIGRLYEDWFIETCEPWVTPYIGDLVGAELGEGPAVWSDRLVVANTLAWRAKPGALTTLGQAAAGATGWPAVAVDLASELILSANVGPLMKGHGSIRIPKSGERDGWPPLTRTAKFGVHPGAYVPSTRRDQRNLDTVAIELWTLPVFAVEGAQPGQAGGLLTVHPDGLDSPLFIAPERFAPSHAPTAIDAPRRLTDATMTTLRSSPHFRSPFAVQRRIGGVWTPVPNDRIRIARLKRGQGPASPSSGEKNLLIVDPDHGLFAFTGMKRQPSPADVRVDYAYGFGGPVGARPYAPPRQPSEPQAVRRVRVTSQPHPAATGWAGDLDEALVDWNADSDLVIEIIDSRNYAAPNETPILSPGVKLEIVALEGCRPVIDGTLEIGGTTGAKLILDGLLLSDGLIANNLSVEARDCTIGVARRRAIKMTQGGGAARLTLDRCIVGPARIEATHIAANRTIFDGRGKIASDGVLALSDPDERPCMAEIAFDHCTVFGDLLLDREVDLSTSVMAGVVTTAHGTRRLDAAFITRQWGYPDYLRLDRQHADQGDGAFGQDWGSRMRNLDEAIKRHLPQGMACAIFLAS